MSIATKCTCGHSLTGACTSSVKECNQLIMEKTTLLPVEVVEQIENDSIERFPVTLTHGNHVRPILMQRAAYVTGATAYATKLHQVEQENAELRRQNDKMKAMATGWMPLLEEVLRRFSGISEAAGQPEDFNLINNIKKFLYGE